MRRNLRELPNLRSNFEILIIFLFFIYLGSRDFSSTHLNMIWEVQVRSGIRDLCAQTRVTVHRAYPFLFKDLATFTPPFPPSCEALQLTDFHQKSLSFPLILSTQWDCILHTTPWWSALLLLLISSLGTSCIWFLRGVWVVNRKKTFFQSSLHTSV